MAALKAAAAALVVSDELPDSSATARDASTTTQVRI